jgi:D-aminopeptidase
VHPSRARELIAAAAESVVRRAVDDGDAFQPLTLPTPIELGVDFGRAAQADYAALMPGASREGDRGVRYFTSDPLEAYRAFVVFVRLAGLVA